MDRNINWKQNLFFIWLSQFLSLAGFSLCMPFIPKVMEFSLGITDQTLRLQYISIYQLLSMLSMCAAMVVWGTLADRFGRKLMLLRASFAAAIFYPLLAFIPNIWLLFLVRFVCSFFSGTYNPAQTLAVSTTPPEKHGFALGLLSTALWSGYMAGYLAGGIIASRFGFTVAFVCGGTLYFVSALLILFLTKDNFSRQNCLKKIKKDRMPLKKLLSPGVCGILLLILIMGIAKRVDEPFLTELVDDVMRRTGSDELNLFFFRITGDSLFFTGLVSAGAALGGFLSGVVFGWCSDRITPWKLLIPVITASAVGVVLQLHANGMTALFAARIFAYFTSGGIMPVLQLMLIRITDPGLRGTYFGWSGSFSTLGGVLCAFLSMITANFAGLHGIYWSEVICFLLMLPMLIPVFISVKKESKCRTATAAGNIS